MACDRECKKTTSGPLWAFDLEGRLVGAIHTRCTSRRGDRHAFHATGRVTEGSIVDGQRQLYVSRIRGRSGDWWTHENLAHKLPVGDERDERTAERRHLPDRWTVDDAHPRGVEAQAAIVDQYTRALREFRS